MFAILQANLHVIGYAQEESAFDGIAHLLNVKTKTFLNKLKKEKKREKKKKMGKNGKKKEKKRKKWETKENEESWNVDEDGPLSRGDLANTVQNSEGNEWKGERT